MAIYGKVKEPPPGGWSNPMGMHNVICTDVVVTGPQETSRGGMSEFVYLVFTNTKGESIHKRYVFNMSEGSLLNKALTHWRRMPIADPANFDLEKVVGARASATITWPDGADFPQVEIGPPARINTGLAKDLEARMAAYERPQWLRDKCGDNNQPSGMPPSPGMALPPEGEDDVPF
jgi:hypothetical protein